LSEVEKPNPPPSFYRIHSALWKQELRRACSSDVLGTLHRRSPWKHFSVAAALFATLLASGVALWQGRWPWIWVPASLMAGLALFDCTILLHEALHHLVFAGPHPRLYRAIEWLYAIPTGISPSQFSRWHLDHHAQLGSDTLDPKRHRLSPKRNSRWLKALYFTPALFVIYFRAARLEAATYPLALRRRILRERVFAIAFHLLLALAIAWFGGWGALLRVYLIPLFLIFPVAFALNRLGQHYAITPGDVAGWSTRMRPSAFWSAAFLWSGYHLEHHDFPGVPFYNLPRLGRALAPILDARGIPERSFGELLWLYLGSNKAPHTEW
jgi:beta-carotene hydroxylase